MRSRVLYRTGILLWLLLSYSPQNIFDEWPVQILPTSYKSVKSIHKFVDDSEEQVGQNTLLLLIDAQQ